MRWRGTDGEGGERRRGEWKRGKGVDEEDERRVTERKDGSVGKG